MLHKPTQQETFQALLDDFSARVRAAFLSAIANIRSRITLSQVIQRLERQDTEGVIRALGIENAVFNPMLDEIDAAYSAGGGGANSELPTIRSSDGFPITVTFDQRNPAAEAWMKQNGATLVRQITDDQVTMLRSVIARDVGAGVNSRQIAIDIVGRISKVTGRREGGLIGLTNSQSKWADNFQSALESLDRSALDFSLRDARFDKMVLGAIERGESLAPEKIATMVSAYRNRALRFRGEAIARTESLTALNAGRAEAMRQAIANGHITQTLVTKTWRSVHDNRVRNSHAELDGQKMPFGSPFLSPLGNRMMHPGDASLGADAGDIVNCRCSVTYAVEKEQKPF